MWRSAGTRHREARSVEAKVADLRRIAGSLRSLIDQCESRQPTVECPILDALKGDA